MEEIILEVQLREEIGKGKLKDLRGQGFIPAVMYAQGKKSKALKVSHRQLWQLIHHHRIESMVINLKMPDDKRQKGSPCLIKEIQYHPVKGDIIHVDFNEISLTKVIKVSVPVVSKGEPVGVKQEGGSLEHSVWEIEVECLPTDIPKNIEVDVSQLKLGDAIHIKDIIFPSTIKVLSSPDATVFSVIEPLKAEVAAPVEEGQEKQEPEVIKEKKEVPAEGEEAKPEKEKK